MHAFVEDFDEKVKEGLVALGVDFSLHKRIGVAVSGGADSISLLTSLLHVVPNDVSLHVITVNHNLRRKEETESDAQFVQDYCRNMHIACERVDVPRGNIVKKAQEQNVGMEAAAREVRYALFFDFVKKSALSFLCLAHNKNDQIETVLMRFLQGSGAESLSGIPPRRGVYIRPMLGISRTEIETYLSLQNIPYCIDKTNLETVMYRNCIRNVIMPILDKEVSGWQKSIMTLSEKMRDDESVLHDEALKAFERACTVKNECATMDYESFCSEPKAIQRRMMFMMFSAIHADNRMPYRLVSDVMAYARQETVLWKEVSRGISVHCDGTNIFVQKNKKIATEKGFFVTIKQVGSYKAGDFLFDVTMKNDVVCITSEKAESSEGVSRGCSVMLKNLKLPFVIRSRQPGDEIKNSLGEYASVAKIMSDWKCGEKKDSIPVVQQLATAEQDILCIWGEAEGFKNWIVRDIK